MNLPAVSWQEWLCSGSQSMPTVYPWANSFSNASDTYFTWIISLNNKMLVLDIDIQRQSETQTWFRVLTHFRDPATGQRYFINKTT